MKLIFCVDDKMGLMFSGKRQSQDKVLREWIINHTQGSKLWMSSYSAKQFEGEGSIQVDEDYMTQAGEGDYCFVEDKAYSADSVEEIILCKWNRKYPGDKFFDIDLKASDFKKIDSRDIVGSSHDKITIETYKRG